MDTGEVLFLWHSEYVIIIVDTGLDCNYICGETLPSCVLVNV